MRPAFAIKSKPSHRHTLRRRRPARQRNPQELGSTVGMPLFLQRQPSAANVLQQDKSEQEALPSSDNENIREPLLNLVGEGITHSAIAYANSLRLQGVTRAQFRNNFTTEDVVTAPAEGCEGCRARNCVHVTGTLVSTFTVTTTVTLPSVANFPNLTSCQQQRVQDAIDNVLAPHEQQHVSAFQSYNGTVSIPFDLTICRSRFTAEIRAMHNRLESSRRSAAQTASDALDPFHFDVDLDCSS